MKCVVPSRAVRATIAATAILVFVGVPNSLWQTGASHAQSAPLFKNPSNVSAVYQIALNGFGIGSFRYTSETSKTAYKLTSDVDLSLLMGAFQWKGVSRTSGQATDAALKPGAFGFDFSSSLKSGSVAMGFANGSVKSVSIDPPAPTAPDTVPVKSEHLVNVLDPLSALLALTQDKGGEPCNRRLAIFDGKQRFDLQLIYRRQEPIEGSSDTASVCRVKYIPIAGFRQTEETANLARSTGIEISFRQAPGARLFVPQKIVLPTLAGTAEIALERIDIDTPGSGQVALINE